jgi:hypothetical protein
MRLQGLRARSKRQHLHVRASCKTTQIEIRIERRKVFALRLIAIRSAMSRCDTQRSLLFHDSFSIGLLLQS